MKKYLLFIIILFFFNINLTYAKGDKGIIGISYDLGTFIINEIEKNSAASKNDLRINDQMIEVDGLILQDLNPNEVNFVFDKEVGENINIILKRDNKLIEKNFLAGSLFETYDCSLPNLSSEELLEYVIVYYQKNISSKVFECSKIGHENNFVIHTSNLGFLYANPIINGDKANYKKAYKYSKIAADKGEDNAMVTLGILYENGQGTDQDINKALDLYLQAAEKRNSDAYYNLGRIFENEDNKFFNHTKSVDFYEKAVEKNYVGAIYNLGVKYYDGYGIDIDYEKAFELFSQGADLGDASSMNYLGIMYDEGQYVEKNTILAIDYYKKSSSLGDQTAPYNLYLIYDSYDEFVDKKLAIDYLTLSAEREFFDALVDLGYHHHYGINVNLNLDKALKYYRMATKIDPNKSISYTNTAILLEDINRSTFIDQILINYEKASELGDANAYYNLSYIYNNALDVDLDSRKAANILKECVEETNDPICLDGLAWHYQNAEGVRQNDKEAVRLLNIAIESEYPRSYGNLGWHYQNGYGVNKDNKKAVELFKKGADLGNAYSQSQLGWHYENGEGVRKDLSAAYYYYSLGKENGNEFAKESIDEFVEKYPGIDENNYLAKINKKEIIKDTQEERKEKIITKNLVYEDTSSNKQLSKNEDIKIVLIPVESEFQVIKKTSVRLSPSSDAGRVKLVNKGDILYIPGKTKNNDWYAVENENGVKIGYIFKNAIKEIEPGTEVVTNQQYGIEWGNYYALIIANEKYENFDALSTPVVDAKELAKTLENKYKFKTELLLNATRDEILDKFFEYRSKLKRNDNLLIYYAGHGDEDSVTKEGYWQPIGSKPNKPSSWISNSEVLTSIRGLKPKHIIMIVDSCFSGAIFKTKGDQNEDEKTPDSKPELEKFYKKKNNKTARVAITSGNLEPVPDSLGNSKHSPFAKSLIDILDDNEEIMLSSALFVKLETYLTNYSNFQETLYSPLSVPEHKYGGHFIFVPSE